MSTSIQVQENREPGSTIWSSSCSDGMDHLRKKVRENDEKKGKKWIFEWKGRLEDQENRSLGEEQRYTGSGLELGSIEEETVAEMSC